MQLASQYGIHRLPNTAIEALKGLTIFGSSFVFALALRLSTLSDPTKVLSFLITPFPDPQIFDPTLFFLAISAIPLSAVLYRLGVWLQRLQKKETDLVSGKTVIGSTEQSPLLQENTRPLFGLRLPILDQKDTWPSPSNAGVDARLLIGAILFGIGWGIEGICRESSLAVREVTYIYNPAGPGLVNLGRSIFSASIQDSSFGLNRWVLWLTSYVVGERLVSPGPN